MNSLIEGKSVLIVDDSERVRDQLNQLYRSLGMNVAGLAAGGLEAIEVMQKVNPDLVSLDIIMPEMDGIECYRKMKEMEGNRRYIFISVLASEERILACYEQEIGRELFLAKPVTLGMLEAKLVKIFCDSDQKP
ncbi:MAG: response regulator [Oligoflexales bacterium]|nr:response regulator [Oligoflexales bacterium]